MKNLALLFLALTVVTSCNVNNDEFRDLKTSVNESELLKEESLTSLLATDSINTQEKKNLGISKCLLMQPEKFVVDPTSDTSISIGKRGTIIHIPSNAFVDKYGCLITSKVEIKVKDYTNSAEMAFSQIPMTYTDKNGDEYNFNSAGMFDISGFSEGQPMQIAPNKTLKFDYALVQKFNGIDFYKLEKLTGKWEQIQKIKTITKRQKLQGDDKQEIHFTVTNPRNMNCNLWFDKEGIEEEVSLETLMKEKYKIPDSLKAYLDSNKHKYQSFSVLFTLESATGELQNIRADIRNPIKCFDEELVASVKSLPPCNYTLLKKRSLSPFKNVYQLRLHRSRWTERIIGTIYDEELLDRTYVKVMGSLTNSNISYVDVGHTYPDIIKGLEVSSFGIYNCDQIYRLKNKVNIIANYINEKGDTINDTHLLSLVDLEYNGAFSFNPNRFTCNSRANNVLLLFTESGKLYILDKGEFQKLKINYSGVHTFKMRNVTNTFTSTDKLKAYFEL